MTPEIDHRIDLVEDEAGETVAFYNYLVYCWPGPAPVVARAYLDRMGEVSVQTGTPTPAMLEYLRDRYVTIKRLGAAGYVEVLA